MDSKTLALYLGCYAMHGDKRIHVCGINVNSGYIQNIMCQETIPISEIKLILRPLSSMTEEEKEQIAKLMSPKATKWLVEILVLDAIRVETWGDGMHSIAENYWPDLFLYLLSKHFDLFGLIEKQEAIDSTK